MVRSKLIEIRDRMTTIVALATLTRPDAFASPPSTIRRETRMLGHVGYDERRVLLTELARVRTENDPFAWGDRTFLTAHQELIDNWSAYRSGDVLDVRVVLGESSAPVASDFDRYTPFPIECGLCGETPAGCYCD